jgi:hypothetical protein
MNPTVAHLAATYHPTLSWLDLFALAGIVLTALAYAEDVGERRGRRKAARAALQAARLDRIVDPDYYGPVAVIAATGPYDQDAGQDRIPRSTVLL